MARHLVPADLGPDGCSTFFARHKCNELCRAWPRPNDVQELFPLTRGTTVYRAQALPQGAMRTPLRPTVRACPPPQAAMDAAYEGTQLRSLQPVFVVDSDDG